MLERKFKKEEHLLKQFKKNGQDRFLIIKKKMSNDDDKVSNEQPADYFKDWKYNLDSEFEQRKKAAIAARKTTTRKLSNRALRKELLKAIGKKEAALKMHSGPENLKKSSPKNNNSCNQKNQFHEIFFDQIPFFAISKMANIQLLNWEKV